MMDVLKYIVARLNEASTWTALTGLLVAAHVNVSPGMVHDMSLYGAILAGVAGVFIKEQGSKPTAQIAMDVLAALPGVMQAANATVDPPKPVA